MSPLLIAQLTDPHVVVPGTDEELFVDNNERLAGAVRQVNQESPQMSAVLATGDLTNWGHPAEYEALASLLEPLAVPVLAIPGNHDCFCSSFPAAMRTPADRTAEWKCGTGASARPNSS